MTTKTLTREQWLNNLLHNRIAKLLKDKAGVTLPKDCKVSVGFPGGGSARKRIGECWTRSRSSLKVNEIFLSPAVTDVAKLADVLVHEAIHAADDCKSGHKGFFRRTALAVGLEGKMTATRAGKELAEWIQIQLSTMPEFAYGSLDLSGRKVQTTRMIKHECPECGAVWRAASKWGNSIACPFCAHALD